MSSQQVLLSLQDFVCVGKSTVVTSRVQAGFLWNSASFGSSSHSTRFKPSFQPNCLETDESLQLNSLETMYLLEKGLLIFSPFFIEEKTLRYFTYKLFRETKWIPKNGSQFGCDFVLYPKSPDKCHSVFCVTMANQNVEIKTIFAHLRVASQTKKKFLLCGEQDTCLQIKRWTIRQVEPQKIKRQKC